MSLSRREDSLSVADKEQIDEICLAFEDTWLSGRRPVLESFLLTIQHAARPTLLRELLLVELEYRYSLAETVHLNDYLVRFPGLDSVVKQALETVGQQDVRRRFLPGHQIGRYRVKRALGSGEFGSVYLAWDSQLEREVAIKVPHSSCLKTDQGRDHFLEEARVVAQLRHPGIVGLFDANQMDDGTVYLVMQYVDGLSLRELLDRGALDYHRATQIAGQVACAVGAAHRRGVFHRDLKPSNILVDREGHIYVTDFGLAIRESRQQQHAGELAGTLAYMAPEQLRGESHQLDGRADIWSIGVVLYQMLTDRSPFTGSTRDELADEILHRDPRPPRQIDARIPKSAESICLRCLAKRPADRYATAEDAARELLRSARPGRVQTRWLVVTAAALLLAIGTIGWVPSIGQPNRPVAPYPATIDGNINVLVWNSDDSWRQGVHLGEDAVRSLRIGDRIRLEVELDRAGYVYILWLDSQQQVQPVYPWQDGKWDQRLGSETSHTQLALPNTQDHGWNIQDGPAGVETVVLLARESPLPPDVALNELLVGLPIIAPTSRHHVWSFHHGIPADTTDPKLRAPNLGNEASIDDPLLQMQRQLAERLGAHFPLIRAVSFSFEGMPPTGESVISNQ